MAELFWRGSWVGSCTLGRGDMGYVETTLTPAPSPEAEQFDALARSLDSRTVMRDPTRGTRVEIHDGDSRLDALVLGLSAAGLFLRVVFEEKAVRWLRDNVR